MESTWLIARSPSESPAMDWSLEAIADEPFCRVSPFVVSAEGAKTQKRVWSELEKKLEEIHPGLTQNI